MTALAITSPLPQFFDLDGAPLTGGALYFGAANDNPETNPQTVYWDAALTQPAAQPVATRNGYAMRAGNVAIVYAPTDYSLTVKDSRGRQVLYAANSEEFSAASQVLALKALYASNAAGEGASLVGVQDAAGNYPGATKTLEFIAATIGLQSTFVTYDTTGAVDAAAVIQGAIDAVDPYKSAFQGFSKIIYLPAGKCKLSTSILHRQGVILVGERGCELYPTGNFPAIIQSANLTALGSRTYSSIGIRGISIVGTNGTTNNAGGGLLNGNLSSQHGIQLGNSDQFNSASYLKIENCFIYNVGGHGIYLHKPAVGNSQWGWTQFGSLQDLTLQACGGYGFYADGVTASGADFASMETMRVHVQGCYGGGVYINGGNDNKLRFTVNNTGTCGTPSGTFTNPAPGPSIQLENQLSTQLWCHIENNNSGEGLVIGRTGTCYAMKVEGLFYTLDKPIQTFVVNSIKFGHLFFGSITAGKFCLATSSSTRYASIERAWYKDTSTSILLSDGNAGTSFAVAGYINSQALGFGPTAQITGGLTSINGESIGYGTGSGQAVSQLTSKATAVTSNTITGQITTFNDSLAAGAETVFAVNCTKCAVGDNVLMTISSGAASPQGYRVRVVRAAAGFFIVAIKNETAGALAEAIVLSYTVIKGAIA